MEYDEIKSNLINEITRMMKETHPDVELQIRMTNKTNGLEKEGIVFLPKTGGETSVSPTIYLDEIIGRIQSGENNLLESASLICRLYESNPGEQIQETVTRMLENPDYGRIFPEVINKEMNEEMLQNTPYREVAPDLVVIARYAFTDDGSAVISDTLASKLMLTDKEVLDYAEKNMETQGYHIEDMVTMLADMMGMTREETEMFISDSGQERMLVITNEDKTYGAAGIFLDEKIREEIRNKLDGDFYILPSSIHECIAIKSDELSPEQAKSMVMEVNVTQLAPEEVLSNNAYFVDKSLKIEIAGVEKEAASETIKMASHIHM